MQQLTPADVATLTSALDQWITRDAVEARRQEAQEAWLVIGLWSAFRIEAECTTKRTLVRQVFEAAAAVDLAVGCCHTVDELRLGYVKGSEGGEPNDPLPRDCRGVRTATPLLLTLAQPFIGRAGWQPEWRIAS